MMYSNNFMNVGEREEIGTIAAAYIRGTIGRIKSALSGMRENQKNDAMRKLYEGAMPLHDRAAIGKEEPMSGLDNLKKGTPVRIHSGELTIDAYLMHSNNGSFEVAGRKPYDTELQSLFYGPTMIRVQPEKFTLRKNDYEGFQRLQG